MNNNDLKEYLNKTNMSIPDLALSLDCNPKYLDRVMRGRVLPGRRLAKDIYGATYGAISLDTKPRKQQPNQQQHVA